MTYNFSKIKPKSAKLLQMTSLIGSRYSKSMPIQERYIFCDEAGHPTALQISPQNRALRYGDGIFETILVEDGACSHLEMHLQRMTVGAKTLFFELEDGDLSRKVTTIVEKLLKDQPQSGCARMRIAAFRAPGGNYLPTNNAYQMLGEIHPLPIHPCSLQTPKRLHLANCRVAFTALSHAKTLNALPYILAAIEAQQNACDDALLLNTDGELAELTASNLFLVIDGRVHTPRASSGCLPGTMRARALAGLHAMHVDVVADAPLTLDDLALASEAFCTNAIQGLQPIAEVIGTGFRASAFPMMMQLRKMLGMQ